MYNCRPFIRPQTYDNAPANTIWVMAHAAVEAVVTYAAVSTVFTTAVSLTDIYFGILV